MLVTTLKKESLKQDIQPSNGLTMKTPDFQHDPDMMIRINDVNFYYGETQALKSINMNLPEKKITSFIGPSGCGKSTLLRCLNRMNDLVEGTRMEGDIFIGGVNTNDPALDVSELRKNIGMVFQKFNPFPKTIFENINFEVYPGQNIEIIGSNGSGKTTLLRTLLGLIQPEQGNINWLDNDKNFHTYRTFDCFYQ